MLVPDRLATGRPANQGDAVTCKTFDGLIATDGKGRSLPTVETKEGTTGADDLVQQSFVDRHILNARTALTIDNQFPQTVRPSDRPTVRLQRTLQRADRCTPSSGLQTRRRSGRSEATLCARASPRSGTRRGRARRDGPNCPRADRRADAERSSEGCSRDRISRTRNR